MRLSLLSMLSQATPAVEPCAWGHDGLPSSGSLPCPLMWAVSVQSIPCTPGKALAVQTEDDSKVLCALSVPINTGNRETPSCNAWGEWGFLAAKLLALLPSMNLTQTAQIRVTGSRPR